MRIHRVLAEACVSILAEMQEGRKVLDRVLEEAFQANPKWGKRDRNFIAETVFEITRWKRALGFVVDSEAAEGLCAAQWRRAGLEIPDWWQWQGTGVDEMAAREEALKDQPRAIRESVPDWLDARGLAELGDRWDGELAALNRRAPVFLRVNRLRGKVDEAIGWLADNGVTASRVPGLEDALVLAEGKMLPKNLLQDGLVEIQDAGSQLIAPMLEVEPGMRVIDACAGAGGKTLHLAALMGGKGEIVAMDLSSAKLVELRKRAVRAGTRIIRTDGWREDTLKRYAKWADRVLIDAPCSGLGTLRRQPDLKWRLTEAGLVKTQKLQRRLLDQYPSMLRAGGKFVYATCSVLASENQGQLHHRGSHFAIEAEHAVSPSATGFDGFYAARMALIG